jgi:hypothetical protein
VLAVPIAIAMIAPTAARADASDMTCTIESLSTPDTIDWAWNAIFGSEDPTSYLDLTGRASCVHATTGSWTATLSATDAALDSDVCGVKGTGGARLRGTLDFTLSNGLKDHRPFSLSFSPDTDQPDVTGTMSVDGGRSTQVTWHFPAGQRCRLFQ